MIRHLQNTLELGLNGNLRDNRMAGVLYGLVISGKLLNTSRDMLKSDLIFGAWNGQIPTIPHETASAEVKDSRLLYLALKNIKKYPEGPNGEYYGIRFCRESDRNRTPNPEHAVLLGANGIGKRPCIQLWKWSEWGNQTRQKSVGTTGLLGK